MTSLLRRLRGMTRGELCWRAQQIRRTAAERIAVRLRPARWRREDLHAALAKRIVVPRVGKANTRRQWKEAHAVLAHRLRHRSSRFALDPALAPELRAAVLARWPAAGARAVSRAEALLADRYDLLGYRGLTWPHVGTRLDWHLDPVHNRKPPLVFWADVPYLDPAIGDHKIIWELNRHQHWLQLGRALWLTGDVRCRRHILMQLGSWLEANPPLVGINWASMLEIALRAISWIWALHFLLPGADADDEPWIVDMFVALDRQLRHVERNLSLYFSPNTHLTGEALSLYVAGVALPELAAASRWAERGRRVLLAEIGRQIHADGGHAERSTHYQRYTLDFYLMALLTAERAGDAEAASAFRDAATRLAVFTRTIADGAGRLPLIGDDDGGMLWPIAGRECHDVRDSLALAAVLLDRPDLAPWGIPEEVFWIGGRRALESAPHAGLPPAAASPSCTFAESGYVVARDTAGGHAVFDVGLHGYLNGGHAHADALAVTLALAGRPLLVDPGTSTYTVDPRLRDQLRSSMSHNTLTMGNRSQAAPAGPFHWHTRSDARLHGTRHNERFDWAEAFHDCYAPLRHRRTLLRSAQSGWLILDEVLGHGRVTVSSHWHFDPGWMLRCEAPGRLKATHFAGDQAWLLHDAADVWLVHGDEDSGLGWYAPVYGTLIPTWTARITRQADAPFTMATWLAANRCDTVAAPSLECLTPTCDSGGTALGARVVDGDRVSIFLVRPGEPPIRDSRGCGILDYQTNARMLHYVEAGPLRALDLADASHALALRDGWISVAVSEPIADLHVSLDGDVLDLRASAPAPEIRLQGAALGRVRWISLNRRAMARVETDRPDTVVIGGGHWPDRHDDDRSLEGIRLPLPVEIPVGDGV